MRKYFITLFAALTISIGHSASTDRGESRLLHPAPYHKHALVAILNLLQQHHYQPQTLDDSLSSKVLDNYFEILDRKMLYFTTTHLASFEKYRFEIDNAIRSGNLEIAFDIYNLYFEQLELRHQHIKQMLDEIQPNQTYSTPSKTRPNNLHEQNIRWRATLMAEIQKEVQGGKSVSTAKEVINTNYVNIYQKHLEYTSEEVFQWFLYAFTKTYDPHTWYASPALKQEEKIKMSLTFGGIGVTIDVQDNYPYVAEVSTRGPAYKSGLVKQGDRILAFSEAEDTTFQSVEWWTIEKVVSNLRGEIGSRLLLAIGDLKKPARIDTVELIRDAIHLEAQAAQGELISVDWEGTNQTFGIITIPSFYRDFEALKQKKKDYKSLTRDVKHILDSLTRFPIAGILLDLRGNGGGYLVEAIDLTDLFIADGTIVQVKNADGSVKQYDSPDKGKVHYDGMLAVLIDRNSASASEIFAGAIQDYGRGLIFGERSFGKGTVQSNYDLGNIIKKQLDRHILLMKSTGQESSSLESLRNGILKDNKQVGKIKITQQMFYLPRGKSTQFQGIEPDISFPSRGDLNNYGERAKPYTLPGDELTKVVECIMPTFDKTLLTYLKDLHDHRRKSNPKWNNYLETSSGNDDIYLRESLLLMSATKSQPVK